MLVVDGRKRICKPSRMIEFNIKEYVRLLAKIKKEEEDERKE